MFDKVLNITLLIQFEFLWVEDGFKGEEKNNPWWVLGKILSIFKDCVQDLENQGKCGNTIVVGTIVCQVRRAMSNSGFMVGIAFSSIGNY